MRMKSPDYSNSAKNLPAGARQSGFPGRIVLVLYLILVAITGSSYSHSREHCRGEEPAPESQAQTAPAEEVRQEPPVVAIQ